MKKGNATNISNFKINIIEWFFPLYTNFVPQQVILSKSILSKLPTELQYVERSVLLKEINTQKLWSFELDTQGELIVPIWTIVCFLGRERQDSQKTNNIKFYRPLVTSAQFIIGTEKDPDSGIILNYNDDDHSHGYGQIKEAFRSLTKDVILQPYLTHHVFRFSIVGNDVAYKLYVFDIRYQKNLLSAQPRKVEFNLSENNLAGVHDFALVLMNKLVSISSDGQKRCDLI